MIPPGALATGRGQGGYFGTWVQRVEPEICPRCGQACEPVMLDEAPLCYEELLESTVRR